MVPLCYSVTKVALHVGVASRFSVKDELKRFILYVMYECLACIVCVYAHHVCPWLVLEEARKARETGFNYVYESTCGAGNPPQVSVRAVNAL